MSDKKEFELSTDKLKNVAGGGTDLTEHLTNHGKWVSSYDTEAYVGKWLYFVRDDDSTKYCLGVLEKSFEQKLAFWGLKSLRVYNITVKKISPNGMTFTCCEEYGDPYEKAVYYRYLYENVSSDTITAFEYTGSTVCY